ncbi:nuclear nucleic acid-binding protein C1D isoform X2 [Nematostella vectensis]|uniref:nuclear nucleic acid-binding protein C1D isoform X2 n=1 Tax=Nematostella vectensis TaxID=45351 RepID=UPI00138FBE06|nr:nuclear nucleic acid-binding protein C1D isoform X2 [Nematostella vectensis]
MAAEVEAEPELPEEVVDSMESFHESLGNIEDALKPLLENSTDDMKESMGPLQLAKLNLVVAYSINSLFWMYLITQGMDPKEHPIKQELDRIKKYMVKVKEVQHKQEVSMRIDKGAAKRFVKSALWQPTSNEDKGKDDSKTSTKELTIKNGTSPKAEKRKREGKSSEKKRKKK